MINQWTYKLLFTKHLELCKEFKNSFLILDEKRWTYLLKANITNAYDFISAFQVQSDEKFSGYTNQDIIINGMHMYTPYSDFVIDLGDKIYYIRRMFLTPLLLKLFPEKIIELNFFQFCIIEKNFIYISDYIFPFLNCNSIYFHGNKIEMNDSHHVIEFNINQMQHINIEFTKTTIFHTIYKNLFSIESETKIKLKNTYQILFQKPCENSILHLTFINDKIMYSTENIPLSLNKYLWKPLHRPYFEKKKIILPSIIFLSIIIIIIILCLCVFIYSVLLYGKRTNFKLPKSPTEYTRTKAHLLERKISR